MSHICKPWIVLNQSDKDAANMYYKSRKSNVIQSQEANQTGLDRGVDVQLKALLFY